MIQNLVVLSDSALSFAGLASDPQDASPSSKCQHPPSFYCPISQQVMHDPVVVSDGHTYERRHIERWLKEHTTSPVSREELSEKAVFPNHALRNAISEYFDQVFSVYRRAIRKSIRGQGEQPRFGSDEPLLQTIDALMQCSFLQNADLNTECVLKQIMNEAKSLLGAEAASVFLVDATKQELYSQVNSSDREICIPITSGIAGHVASTGEPLLIPDAYQDDRFNRTNDMKTGFKTDNILCVPLTLKRGAVIGVVQLINKTGAGVFGRKQAFTAIAEETPEDEAAQRPSFTAHDLQFLQVFASQAATAVANSGGVGQRNTKEEVKHVDDSGTASMDLKKCRSYDLVASDFDAPQRFSSKSSTDGELRSSSKSSTDSELRSSSKASADGKLASVLSDAFKSWEFDALTLVELTDNKPLSTLGVYLFERLGLVQEFNLDTEKLENFFVCIEEGYDDANAYHNRCHAASVMHAMHALLEHGGLAKTLSPVFKGTSSTGSCQLQRLACLLAAAVHDHEHLGLTNEFLVRTRHERATLYNDQHVNENHHVASAFAILNRPECNFLSDLADQDFRQLRSIVIELVLGTDMAKGSNIHKSFNETFGVDEGCPCAPASTQEAMLLLQMAMKCADLGHLALSWDLHLKWVSRVEAEFFAQGDKEKAAGLPVSSFMDRNQPGCSKSQTGFFEFVALPLLRSVVHVLPAAQPMLDTVVTNYFKWKDANNTMMAAQSDASDAVTRLGSFASDATDGSEIARKKSGRSRQRAAKYWASVRCRTPSPEPVMPSFMVQRC